MVVFDLLGVLTSVAFLVILTTSKRRYYDQKPTQLIAYSSILVAFAILIPMIMPIKLIIGPAFLLP